MNRIPLLRYTLAITTAAVVVGAAGAGTTAAIALGFSVPKTQNYDYSVDHAIDGSQLTVTTGFAHLKFVPSPDDSLHVRAHGIYRGDAPRSTSVRTGRAWLWNVPTAGTRRVTPTSNCRYPQA